MAHDVGERSGPDELVMTFEFRAWGTLTDGVVDLVVERCEPEEPARGHAPCYHFRILRHSDGAPLGGIRLRVGTVATYPLLLFAGHVGYEIDAAYRGHGYAGRACRQIRPVALAHGLDHLVVTCSPTNLASRRTIERLGATLVGVFELAPGHPAYRDDRRSVCRFEWWLGGAA